MNKALFIKILIFALGFSTVVLTLVAFIHVRDENDALLKKNDDLQSSINKKNEIDNLLSNNDQNTADTKTNTSDESIIQNQQQITIPVQEQSPTIQVKLYYKNYKKDPNVMNCDADEYITKDIPLTTMPLTESIKLLLTNELSQSELDQGLISPFTGIYAEKSVANFTLTSASISNGEATLKFSDTDHFTIGGSCRVGLQRSSIEKTALQFSSVKSVKFVPDLLFQP